MNIYKYALKLEKDSEGYYKKLISKTDDVGLQTILKMLVDEEVKHFNIVEQMMKTNTYPELIETNLLKNARNIFEKNKKKKLESKAQKNLLLKLAEEEKKHIFLLENLVEFVSRPDTWIEDAEFNHLDEY